MKLCSAAIVLIGLTLAGEARAEAGYRVEVHGSVEEAVSFWKERDFWGEEQRGSQLRVPRAYTVIVNKSWRAESEEIPLQTKKELFYRSLLPLILHANERIAEDRARLERLSARHRAGEGLAAEELAWLRDLSIRYRLLDPAAGDARADALVGHLGELAARVDGIPPSLALGQGAYESGYATSRFALEGNSLFGMWTWGGQGLLPREQRSGKGDYRVASYLWPSDSVRAYMMNLNTQRAYAELRSRRAALRAGGTAPTGLALVGTLIRYSERGQAYVDTLRGIIQHNQLDIADGAILREEPAVLLLQAEDHSDASEQEAELARLRASGELDRIVSQMGLGLD